MLEFKDLLPYTKKLKLLCIDGDDAVRHSLVKTFSRIFAQVDEAADGYDGLNHYKINQHELIITEIDLANYSAIAMIEQIKKITPSQRLIVISKTHDVNTLLQWSNVGIDGFIPKPISMQMLLEIMYKSVVQLYSAGQKAQQVNAAEQVKVQKQQLQEHYEANEKKLTEALTYERKRLGRLLGQERETQLRLSEQELRIEEIRLKDDLTGLGNTHALRESMAKAGNKALLFIDIDHFDTINTLYGMGYGNKVLKETGSRLKRFLPSNAELFRISADEFVILIFSPQPNQELLLSQQILAMFKEAPVLVGDIEFDVSFSIGMDKGEHNKLFMQAKTASAEAKERGRGQMVVFKSNSRYVQQQRASLHWVQTVKSALKNDRVMSFYQPIHNNTTGAIEKYEALGRILDAEGRLLAMDTVVNPEHLAGLMTKVTKVIIDKAFKYFQTKTYAFSLNVSEQDFRENYLEAFLSYKCDYYHIEPQRVYIEIVGNVTLKGSNEMLEQIKRLRSRGFNIMLDDFGVEQSVFSRLLRLEAKTIKIDGSFIKNIDTNLSHQMIVENIVAFAKRIGAETIAELVDTKQVHDKVCLLGINYSQGEYIGEASAEIRPDPSGLSSANNIAI